MKKNTMMRLASFLLIAVLITTSAISGTYAKYVTSDSASDTARVAKWGVTVMVSGELFGTDYNAVNESEKGNEITAQTSTSVSALDSDDVVAPGTKNTEGLTIAIDGKPEVKTKITAEESTVAKEIMLAANTYGVMVKATGLNADTNVATYYTKDDDGKFALATGNWASGTDYYELHDSVTVQNDYYPLTWTVVTTGSGFTAPTKTRLANIQDEMVAGLNNKEFNAETDLAGSYKLTWEWKFSNENIYADGADTILGNLQAVAASDFEGEVVKLIDGNSYKAVESSDYELGIDFGFKVTVTQVD